MKKWLIIWLPLVMFVVSLIVGVLFSIFYNIEDDLKTVLVQLDITILGFAITAFSIIIGFMKENEIIKTIMAKGHLKRCIISIVLLTLTTVVSMVAIIFKSSIDVIFVCSLNCYFQLIFIIYFILVLGYHSTNK